MHKITFPLQMGSQGFAVANLQSALFLLIERGVFKTFTPPNEPSPEQIKQLAECLKDEHQESDYGKATRDLVSNFQIQQRLDDRDGIVDEETANAFNAFLQRWGLLHTKKLTKIIFPLVFKNTGSEVGDLQDALLLLLEREVILRNKLDDRKRLTESLKWEHKELGYYEATRELVTIFQETLGLEPTGEVDEATADEINAFLQEWGLLDQSVQDRSFVVSGHISTSDAPLKGALVRAFHVPEQSAIRLGEDTTDLEGRYTIRYELLPGLAKVNLRVEVYDKDGVWLQSSEIIEKAGPLKIVNLVVPVTRQPPEQLRLEGRIIFDNNLPAEQLKLCLYRLDFGGKETLLGKATTLAGGRYALDYDAGNQTASLEVRAVKNNGTQVPLSRPLNELTAESRANLNLVAPSSLQPIDAEYRRLSADLKRSVGDMQKLAQAKENDKQQDLTVLNRATGWDARLIALASITERLAKDLVKDLNVGLSSEALYGLLRAGLPSDRLLLAQVETDVAERALKKVRDAHVVKCTDAEIEQFKTDFASFANKARLTIPTPGSRSTYGELLNASGLGDEAQAKFASVYLNHRGDTAELWAKARREAGLNDTQIGKLQLQGKLAFLAGNSEAMTTRLLNKGLNDPVELAQDFHDASAWKRELFAQADIPQDRQANLTDADRKKLEVVIPAVYAGAKVETQLETYAEDMARKVRLSYPTQVLGQMLETDSKFKELADADSIKLLKNSAANGFRLGETPVDAHFKTRMTKEEFKAAEPQLQQVKTLQRIYQITPSNEAMPVLMSLGMTSAYDMMAYPEAEFVTRFKAEHLHIHQKPAPVGMPELVYRKAQQVSGVTYNLFTIAKKFESEPAVAGLSAPMEVRERVKNELIKHFPTMESLFGSMDFCECEHCRSVLSPAAYLVDLLQFVDTEPRVWGNFLAQWKATRGNQDYPHKDKNGNSMKPYDVLIERRPDLPHIALTCENTHTALPYIDIVNEILEYYVAHGKLEKEAAHDTGDATTAELLAEPQNVIREAYDALRAARYPINLPFDLWIETVRQFCNYFETPLDRILEVLHPGDDLFALGQSVDRAAIFTESLGLSPADVAVFCSADPLAYDQWHDLYGFPSVRTAIRNPTNVGDATLSVSNADAGKLREGLAYTYFDSSANALSEESKVIAKIGAPDSGGAGQTTITFVGAWAAAPDAGDLVVCDAPAMLKSAKALSQRLGVTYKEITEIMQTGFVNPELSKLSLLYKLGVGITDARFYVAHKALPQDPATLSTDDQKRRLEVEAFSQGLADLAATFKVPAAQLEDAVQAIPFNRVLVLADPDAGCNFDLTTLQYSNGTKADPIVFLRINLFVRLWRRLDWSIEEVDRALQTLVPKNTPFEAAQLAQQPLKTALIYLAHLKALDEKLKVGKQSRLKLLTFWSDIATTGKKPLYVQLFLTRSVLKSAPVFDHPLGQYLTDPTVKMKDHALALQGALGLTADEIGRILGDAGKSLDTADLSLPNVSLFYRYSLLAKALKLTVRELIVLKQLSGLDPFKPLHPDPLATIDQDHPFSQTIEFVKVAEEVKDSGLKIEDLDYLLRHRFDETGKYRPDRAGTLALLKSLTEGVRTIRAEHAVPDDPGALSDDVLRQKLGLVLPADVVVTFMAMMNGTAEFTPTKSLVAPANRLLPEGFADEPAIREVSYNATLQEQKLTFRGVLFNDQKNQLKAAFNPALNEAQQKVFADLLDDVQKQARSFFDLHLLKQTAGLQPASGFLDAADYDLLFAPPPAGLIEAQQQARERQRRTRLAQAFLSFLQQRLIRQFILQTMTVQTGADAVLVESLLADDRLLAAPKPLLDAFASTTERGVSAAFFDSDDGSGAPQATTTIVTSVDTALKDKKDTNGNSLNPARSVRFEGHLEVPTPGAYRFYIELDKQNAEAELRFPHLPEPVFLKDAATANHATLGDERNEFLELKAGVLYRFSLDLKKLNGGEAKLLVQGETLSKGPLSQLMLYPAAAMDAAERATTLLNKVLQLLQSLGLSEREIRYLLTHAADFGGVSLSELPTVTVGDAPVEKTATAQRFGRFRRLAAYARLKRDLAGGTDDLIGIFEASPTLASVERQNIPLTERIVENVFSAHPNLNVHYDVLNNVQRLTYDGVLSNTEAAQIKALFPGSALLASLLDELRNALPDRLKKIAKLTRRGDEIVKTCAAALFPVTDIRSEKPLCRLWEAFQVVERFGVPPVSLLGWSNIFNSATTAERRFAIARDLKEAIKARFEPETWQRVAQPIFDKLRQRQRDALVSYVMQQHGFDRMEQLYEHFLIDPGMEPVVQTSRIRLAISSLQLFVQRCLLNLERKVHPSTINSKHWEWMKRYRVWEANRKIFLFPENWLEPEFRDDKTHLFTELEGALLQGDVSNDLVEDAFLKYLKKLEELARLDIVAMHIEDNPDPARRILHVFGRTYSQPHKYFYRRYAHQMWTPWEPVSAEIEGDHLAPVVWRDRLYLFWVTFIDKADPNPSTASATGSKRLTDVTLFEVVTDLKAVVANKQVEVQLQWSEYLQGEWSTRESGGFSSLISKTVSASFTPSSVFIYVSKEYDPADGTELGVFIHMGGAINRAFYLAGRNSAPESKDYGIKPNNPFDSANKEIANRYSGNGALKVSFKERLTTEPGKPPPPINPSILQQGGSYTLLPGNNNLLPLGVSEDAYRDAANPAAVKAAIESGLGEIASLIKPVFYQDNRHTFFVEPDVTERTIEEWQEWVTRTPQPEPGWQIPNWWDDLVVIPEFPWKWPIPNPGDPWRLPIDPGSLIKPIPNRDWLVNPGTAIRFDDVLIGPTGQPGIGIVTSVDAAAGQGHMSVNPGGGLPGGSTVVLHDENTFANSGLKAIGGGLNIIGDAGFNSALEKNFKDLNQLGFGAGALGAVRLGR